MVAANPQGRIVFEQICHSQAQTTQAAKQIYKKYLSVQSRVIILLQGHLGVGKTFFVQSLGESLGIKQQITSPSFNLLNLYNTDKWILCHYDLYRLQSNKASNPIEDLDFSERWCSEPPGDKQILHTIEWPELALPYLPKHVPIYKLVLELVKQDDSHTSQQLSNQRTLQFSSYDC